jgi:Fe-S-cluster-containing dehydrogenase component/anaerobic selenocysteine-containing dehydrogenase
MNKNSNHESKPFETPRHWLSTEELTADYWNNPAVQELRGQEFSHKPVETIALIDKLDTKGIARRDFLTLMGASMAMASLSCARRPVNKIIPYVVQPEEITPGVPNFYASTDPETGEGLLVKTREGRPIKLEGNPDHPVNRGKLSARTQASLLELYDPDRLQEPKAMSRKGASTGMDWAQLDAAVVEKLKASGGKVRILSSAQVGPSRRKLTQEFLAAFGAGAADKHIEFEVLSLDEIQQAQNASYGTSVVPQYLFDRAEVVVSFGADFLGTWISPVEHAAAWSKKRKLNSKNVQSEYLSKLFVLESMMTVTGANADERLPIPAGSELRAAMAVAHALVAKGRGKFAGDAAVKAALASFSPAKVSQELGLANAGVETFEKIADALWAARGKGLVVGGNAQSRSGDQVGLQIAINLLNSLCENEGVTVDGVARADVRPQASFERLATLIKDMNAGQVSVLILHRVNPIYQLPKSFGFADALSKVGTVISISSHADETAQQSDFALPDHHPLENWGDAQVRKGVMSLQQPTLAPLFISRAFEDSLLAWIRLGKLSAAGLAAKVASAEKENTWHDYLKANWKDSVHTGAQGSFNAFWEKSLRDGVVITGTSATPSARSFKTASVSQIKAAPLAAGLKLVLYPTVALGDGRAANNAWLQEMPDPVSTMTWDNFVSISPATAKSLGLKKDDVIEVSTAEGKFELPVAIQPGNHPETLAVAIGYGRTSAGKVGNGVGVNAYPWLRLVDSKLAFAGNAAQVKKTGKVYQLAETQYHHVSENRPIINDITIADFKQDPGMSNHTDPHLRMKKVPTIWPEFKYQGYRWGMAIDLNSCTGCGACIIGCQAENNIPVVGRDNVRKGREMHWIRLDRYYSGDAENPKAIFQPMLCQHCENAPCETVCPVLATVHDDEGMNSQVYNRCVGTRYCQNNCPYKVRRFNFFDHWKNYEGTANLVWNPDVTVRTRGIMEKCSFCVQRIEKTRVGNKLKGEKIKDGDIKTACQQTCPTDAIVFGNINDPESLVSKLQKDARAFRSLEILAVKPSISYLTKVRNIEGSSAHHGGAGEHKAQGGEHHG